MCGLNAIFGPKRKHEWIDSMNANLEHRGPDARGVYHNDKHDLSLGSTRLKIIDLENGDMPYRSDCSRYSMVFNGEIYNHKELKKGLGGYAFKSQSDGEVFFALLQKEGADALSKVNGMFSFAFYDQHENSLMIARDRLGIKPLFYAQQNNTFYISSEIPALLTIPGLSDGIDHQALYHYMSLLAVPEPYTLYPKIRRFPQACFAKIENGNIKFTRFWEPNFNKSNLSKEQLEKDIAKAFKKSIEKRLIADVPVGVLLSGGIDSTIIAHTVASIDKKKAHSFSMGFEDGENENALAIQTAKELGIEHKAFTLKASDIMEEIPNIIKSFGEPFAGGLPIWFICREVKKHVTVALTGTGGDEMFGNYGRIRHLRPELGFLSGLKNLFRLNTLGQSTFESLKYQFNHGAPAGHFFHEKNYPMKEWQKRKLFKNPNLYRTDQKLENQFWEQTNLELEDRLFNLEMKNQLSHEFLYSQDILSMAHHVELRVPFLDHQFVELMASVPTAMRSQAENPKGWMKKIFSDKIPAHIRNKQKTGFMVPYGNWMRTGLKPMAEKLLDKNFINQQGIFNSNIIDQFWTEHLKGADHSYYLWSIMMFQLWFKQKNNEPINW
jgi:asparagine synthase (glutamine-hydrolysing)